MVLTKSERILNATTKNGRFDRKVAERTFRKEATALSPRQFHDNVMRVARNLCETGKLTRTTKGVYSLAQ